MSRYLYLFLMSSDLYSHARNRAVTAADANTATEVTGEPLYRDRVCGIDIGRAQMVARIRVPSESSAPAVIAYR
jgi:hypothetical protein